jgi:hypothetical protein
VKYGLGGDWGKGKPRPKAPESKITREWNKGTRIQGRCHAMHNTVHSAMGASGRNRGGQCQQSKSKDERANNSQSIGIPGLPPACSTCLESRRLFISFKVKECADSLAKCRISLYSVHSGQASPLSTVKLLALDWRAWLHHLLHAHLHLVVPRTKKTGSTAFSHTHKLNDHSLVAG